MPVEQALLELLESEVTLAPPAGPARRDGLTTPGEPVTIQAHVKVKRHMVRNQAGEEVPAEGRVSLDDYYAAIDHAWTLTLPDGSSPEIITVDTRYGPNVDTGVNGPYQTVLHFGATA